MIIRKAHQLFRFNNSYLFTLLIWHCSVLKYSTSISKNMRIWAAELLCTFRFLKFSDAHHHLHSHNDWLFFLWRLLYLSHFGMRNHSGNNRIACISIINFKSRQKFVIILTKKLFRLEMGRIQTLNKQINMKQFLNFCTSYSDVSRKGRTCMYKL